jgi:hypothetical protein
MRTRSRKPFLGRRARPTRNVDSLTVICEPTVKTMWDPQHLTTLQDLHGLLRGQLYNFICTSCSYLTGNTYGPPRPATRRALHVYMQMMFVPHRRHLYASTACYGDSFTCLHVDDVRTSQKTHLYASTACYGDSFTCLYVDDVHTSQETFIRFYGLSWG